MKLRNIVISAIVAAGVSPAAPSFASDKTVVVFIPSSTNRYIAQWEMGAKTKAAELGYDVKIIENNFDQAEQDSQVRQQLASGESVAGYVWWPFSNSAGIASMRALKKSGAPVIMTNQYPIKGTEKFWTAYAGVNDFVNGADAGKMLLAACDARKFDCKAGIVIRFPVGYSAGDDRIKGFDSVVGDKLKTITVGDSGGFQEAEGYKISAQIIPPLKKQISWVYGNNDALAIGALQALRESGLEPNKDVLVVGGTCHGDPSHLVNGDLVGTAIQPAFLEGWLSVQTLHKYLKTGTVQAGEAPVNENPDVPPSDDGAPFQYNYIPNPMVAPTEAAYKAAKVWGYTMKQLCEY